MKTKLAPSRKIIRLRENSRIPEGAIFLRSEKEHDFENARPFWVKKPGAINQLASLLFLDREILKYEVPITTFFYYEVSADGS